MGDWVYCKMANLEGRADSRMKIMSLSFGGLRDDYDVQIGVGLEGIRWVSGDGKNKR